MSQQRFILIAWPHDHDEDLATHASDLQDCIDMAMMGGARVSAPLPAEDLLAVEHEEGFDELF